MIEWYYDLMDAADLNRYLMHLEKYKFSED